MWDPHVHFYSFLVCLIPETNYLVPVSISFIIIEYSLNIWHFLEYFKNLVFRFQNPERKTVVCKIKCDFWLKEVSFLGRVCIGYYS